MKKHKLLFLIQFMALVVSLMGPLMSVNTVKAANVSVSGLNANDATIWDDAGNNVTGQKDLDRYSNYTAKYQWKIDDGVMISAGDTTSFSLPDNVVMNSDVTFNITNNDGKVVGTGTILKGQSQGTITFSNALEDTNFNREGHLFLNVIGTHSGGGPASYFINKIGWVDGSTYDKQGYPTEVIWEASVNPGAANLKNVVLTDTLGEGQEYISNSMTLTKRHEENGQWVDDGTITPNVTVNGKHLTINLGDISTNIDVVYKVKVTNLNSNGGNTWSNTISANTSDSPDHGTTVNSNVVWGGGGTGNGSSGSVDLVKYDEQTHATLANTTFDLYKDNVLIKSGLTTDANGKISVANLAAGDYSFVEHQSAAGHRLSKTSIPFTISKDHQHADVSAYNTAVVSVTGTKTWVDDNDAAGKRPQSVVIDLYANGSKKDSQTVSNKSKWQYAFDNLQKYDNQGKVINYTVKEEPVANYKSTQTSEGFTNTYVPSEPDKPGEPSNPETPGTPEVPSTPGIPETPSVPSTPELPSTPNKTETPNTSVVPNKPSTSSESQAALPKAALPTPTNSEPQNGEVKTAKTNKEGRLPFTNEKSSGLFAVIGVAVLLVAGLLLLRRKHS